MNEPLTNFLGTLEVFRTDQVPLFWVWRLDASQPPLVVDEETTTEDLYELADKPWSRSRRWRGPCSTWRTARTFMAR